jgi:hypothetical protein
MTTQLTDSQKLDIAIQNIDELLGQIGALKEGFTVLCKATQDIVDKLPDIGIPKRPTSNESAAKPKETPQQPQPTGVNGSSPAPTGKVRNLEDIKMIFPEEIADKLDFQIRDQGKTVIIKPIAFLGSETFGKVAGAVRGMGGEYISAQKDSHFRVPTNKRGA